MRSGTRPLLGPGALKGHQNVAHRASEGRSYGTAVPARAALAAIQSIFSPPDSPALGAVRERSEEGGGALPISSQAFR